MYDNISFDYRNGKITKIKFEFDTPYGCVDSHFFDGNMYFSPGTARIEISLDDEIARIFKNSNLNVRELRDYFSETIDQYISVRFTQKYTIFDVIDLGMPIKPDFDNYDYGIMEINCEIFEYKKWRVVYATKVKIVPIAQVYHGEEVQNERSDS